MLNRLLTLGLFLLGIVSPALAQRDPRGDRPGRGGGGGENRPRPEQPRQQPPRQEQPRQQPPRQEQPRQQPPRQEQPRQQPPRQQPPREIPRENPRQAPPRENPRQNPPREIPRENPRQNPPREIPRENPRQNPPREIPRENPRQNPPREIPRENPRQNPPRQQPPRQQPPRQEPPRRRPPVIVPQQAGLPGQPGRGRVMPVPPRPIDHGGILDPRRHGDGRAHSSPNRRWDGNPITHRPWTNPYGRHIPPSRDHVTIINNTTIINNITVIQRGWDVRDHGHSWYYWNGHRLSHRYDDFGYHWWGFYVGNDYFWTRYSSGRHWWYDPYYQRWVYLHDGRWWWQNPAAPTVVYVIIDNNYYRYQDNAGTVIVRPDPTTPVVAPPAEPNVPTTPEPDEETMYSLDGTRSVRILTDKKEAYLYDLTATDPNGAGAGGRWLASGVKSAKFVYDDKHEADGTTTQIIRQIELDFEEADLAAVADAEGERKIVISGTERSASLYNLKDETVPEAYLASGVSEIKLVNAETTDAAGQTVRALKLVIVTGKDASGVDSLFLFSRDGAPYDAAAPQPAEGAAPSPAETLGRSAAFNELSSGKLGW